MAVDWVAQNVYWVDPSFNWIRVAAINKQFVLKTTIIYTNIDTPSGLAVIPALRFAFQIKCLESSYMQHFAA
jgi:hypothetical protein